MREIFTSGVFVFCFCFFFSTAKFNFYEFHNASSPLRCSQLYKGTRRQEVTLIGKRDMIPSSGALGSKVPWCKSIGSDETVTYFHRRRRRNNCNLEELESSVGSNELKSQIALRWFITSLSPPLTTGCKKRGLLNALVVEPIRTGSWPLYCPGLWILD